MYITAEGARQRSINTLVKKYSKILTEIDKASDEGKFKLKLHTNSETSTELSGLLIALKFDVVSNGNNTELTVYW